MNSTNLSLTNREKTYIIYIVRVKGDDFMLAKYWKQIGLFILIIAILFNITIKLINKVSLKKTITQSAQYMIDHEELKENTVNE